ncbi:hypothetical protein VNI00_009680 [Paramarasmius palmivorus]|uniref:Uncharacterized protein n=1 Tax=Paramarasmius palmivorus TaxID=297713 RepID=A0AAW0CRC2_9AGAR
MAPPPGQPPSYESSALDASTPAFSQLVQTTFQQLGAVVGGLATQVNDLAVSVEITNAQLANIRQRKLNQMVLKPETVPEARSKSIDDACFLRMLHKTVPGSGIALAQRLRPKEVLAEFIHEKPPSVGDVHPLALGRRTAQTLSHIDILNLMMFYNEDFWIVTDDSLEARREKMLVWLTI